MGTIRHETEHQLRLPTAKATKGLMESEPSALPEELLSVLLHDLRSPLGAIGVLVELISSVSEDTAGVDPRQLQLLREAAIKAERMLDDAVEIQSVIRGSSTFTSAVVEIDSLVRTCLEKASHAPYFKNTEVHYTSNGSGQNRINIDVEKAESAILCAFEQVVARGERPTSLHISHSVQPPFVNLHLINGQQVSGAIQDLAPRSAINPLRGRLGNRRLGESRYSFQVCRQVMQLMGGHIDQPVGGLDREIIMSFPMAPLKG